jgi:hypothetical protein
MHVARRTAGIAGTEYLSFSTLAVVLILTNVWFFSQALAYAR